MLVYKIKRLNFNKVNFLEAKLEVCQESLQESSQELNTLLTCGEDAPL